MKQLHALNKQPKGKLIILGVSLTLMLGLIDYLSGPELSFSIFYLLPISLATWLINRRSGIGLSLISAALWLVADLSAGHIYAHPLVPYWNVSVRLGFFLIITYVLARLRASIQWQEELSHLLVHDLRAPLANIMTGLQLLEETAGEATEPTQKEVIATCLSSGQRMLTLINLLLDLARLEKGEMPLQSSQVQVRDLIQGALNQVRLWAEYKGIYLESQLEAPDSAIYADPMVTTNILVNLLSNAIKFSQSNTVVTVQVVPAGMNMIAFNIIDQGPGIPKEGINKVFDKFKQLEARPQKAAGTGLGLFFCRLAVELQGGRIWLRSRINQGTTVTFVLPCQADIP